MSPLPYQSITKEELLLLIANYRLHPPSEYAHNILAEHTGQSIADVQRRCAALSVKCCKPTGMASSDTQNAEGEAVTGHTFAQETLRDTHATFAPINALKTQPSPVKETTQKPIQSPESVNEVPTARDPTVTDLPRTEGCTSQQARHGGNATANRTEASYGKVPLKTTVKLRKIDSNDVKDLHWEIGDSLEAIARKIHLVTSGTRLIAAERAISGKNSSQKAMTNKEQIQSNFRKAYTVKDRDFGKMATWLLDKVLGDPGFHSFRAALYDANRIDSDVEEAPVLDIQREDHKSFETDAMIDAKKAYEKFCNSRTRLERLQNLIDFHEQQTALSASAQRKGSADHAALMIFKERDPEERIREHGHMTTLAARWLFKALDTETKPTKKDPIRTMRNECRVGGFVRAIQRALGNGAILFVTRQLQNGLIKFSDDLFPAFLEAINATLGPQFRSDIFEQAAQAVESKVCEPTDVVNALRDRSDIIKNSIAEAGKRVDELLDKIRSGEKTMDDEDEAKEHPADLRAKYTSRKLSRPSVSSHPGTPSHLTPTHGGEGMSGATQLQTVQPDENSHDTDNITAQHRKRGPPSDGGELREKPVPRKKFKKNLQGVTRSSEEFSKKDFKDTH